MPDLADDIRSLSDFKRNTVDLLERLREDRTPPILTIAGKAEFVVQDAAAFHTLLDRAEAIEGIQQVDWHEGRPHETCAAGIRSAALQAWHTAARLPISGHVLWVVERVPQQGA